MFKKSAAAAAARHKKKAQQLRHRTTEDDDDDDEDEDNPNNATNSTLSLSVQLTETKKRRQLLTQLQYKRGVDAAEVLMSQPTAVSVSTVAGSDAAKNHNLTQTLTSSTSSEGHIWDQKHKAAMECFVQQQLQKDKHFQSTNDSEMDETKRLNQSNCSLSKEDLYQQLARKAAQLSGKPLASDERNSPVGIVSESIDTSHEVLTAGAATAMAEVVLPVEHDWAVIAETARVVAQRRHQQHQQPAKTNMPHRVVPSANPAVPNRFRAYNSARMIQHQQPHEGEQPPQHSTNNKGDDRSEDNNGELFASIVASTAAAGNPASDQDRVGFTIARQQQQQQNRPFQRQTSERNNQKHGRSSDERVYRQFLKRTREHQR